MRKELCEAAFFQIWSFSYGQVMGTKLRKGNRAPRECCQSEDQLVEGGQECKKGIEL